MTAHFDTLQIFNVLVSSGISSEHAKGITEALNTAMNDQLVTKKDLEIGLNNQLLKFGGVVITIMGAFLAAQKFIL